MRGCKAQIEVGKDLMRKQMGREKKIPKNQYFDNSADFMTMGRALNMGDFFEIEKANKCIDDCNRPIETMKRAFKGAFKDINDNFHKCLKARAKSETDEGHQLEFEQGRICMETNIQILKSFKAEMEDNQWYRKEFV